MRTLLVTNDFPPKVGGIQSYLEELWRRLDPDARLGPHRQLAPRRSRLRRHAARRRPRRRARGRLDAVRARRQPAGVPSIAAIARRASRTSCSSTRTSRSGLLGRLGPRSLWGRAARRRGRDPRAPPGRPPRRAAGVGRRLGRHALRASIPRTRRGASRARGSRPVVQVPPGVDTTRFNPPDRAARRVTRERLGLPVDGPLVASVGRLVHAQGPRRPHRGRRAVRVLARGRELAVAGDGRDGSTASAPRGTVARRRRASSARVSEADKVALLGAADVFAQPCRSRWGGLEQEGFGIVFVEAAACGIPQVAGRSGGSYEAVDDGSTGLVVDRPASTRRRRRGPRLPPRGRAEASGDGRRSAAPGSGGLRLRPSSRGGLPTGSTSVIGGGTPRRVVGSVAVDQTGRAVTERATETILVAADPLHGVLRRRSTSRTTPSGSRT